MSNPQPRPRFLLASTVDRAPLVCSADLALARAALARCPLAVLALGERMRCIGPILRARRRALAPWLPACSLQDLEQSVAQRVLECLPRFAGLAALESWIFSFCDGAVRNAGRRQVREHDRLQPLESAARMPAPPPAPDRHRDLCDCLQRLGSRERDLLVGKHWDGSSLEQLAARAGVPLGTVKSRYWRALEQVRECLDRVDRRGGTCHPGGRR